MWLSLLLVCFACSDIRARWDGDLRPSYIPTNGELLPRAHVRNSQDDFLIVPASSFEFRIVGKTCDIVENATARYKSIMEDDEIKGWKAWVFAPVNFERESPHLKGELVALDVHLINPCQRLPHLRMNENYTLTISGSTKSGVLRASEVWGILRGLESFSQLIAASPQGLLVMKCQEIRDSPRFPHRGIMLDTSRHYFPVSEILQILDAMSYNKLNVFHWHIVDDKSFPYVSTVYPELSEKGAFNRTMIYTQANVRDIVEYARLRGIRVIAEFDTPGHTASWGLSHPEILTACYKNGKPNGTYGPMNPTKPEVWTLLKTFYDEIFRTFSDRHIHLGGDRFSFDCWASNPDILESMRQSGYKRQSGYDFEMLEGEFYFRLLSILKEANVSIIVWAEAYKELVGLPAETILQVTKEPWQTRIKEIVSDDHFAVLSTCWNLTASHTVDDWMNFYECDPTNFDGTTKMKSRIIGGEIIIWSEHADGANVHQRIWPRASAAAESLWSPKKETTERFSKRLEEHSCRMKRRGVSVEPIGFNSCLF